LKLYLGRAYYTTLKYLKRIGFAQDSETCVPAKVLYSAEAKTVGAEKTGTGRGEEIDFSTAERIEREKAAPGCPRSDRWDVSIDLGSKQKSRKLCQINLAHRPDGVTQ
jgi:hypothetical protein